MSAKTPLTMSHFIRSFFVLSLCAIILPVAVLAQTPPNPEPGPEVTNNPAPEVTPPAPTQPAAPAQPAISDAQALATLLDDAASIEGVGLGTIRINPTNFN